MDLFRWRRTLLRALGPACLCGLVAAWGTYALTRDDRPTYRSAALLATGVMTGADSDGQYVRDLVINELEGIMNLARSFETREELATRLLADYLALADSEPSVISRRAYVDLKRELDPGIIARHARAGEPSRVYASLVAERDSLRRYGEATAEHPLIALLYGDNELVGIEHLGRLRVSRRGLSDILEISYATVDAAWCKRVLDRHLEVFLAGHAAVKAERSDGALAYFRRSTAEARGELDAAEERLRLYAAGNRIINYYEQTRAIAAQKALVDNSHTEEQMRHAAADETLVALEARLARRVDLVRLNGLVDARRREIAELSRERVRLEIMSSDSTAAAGGAGALAEVDARLARLRETLSRDIVGLQGVYNGPEGLEVGRLLGEWLAATIAREEARAKVQVLERRRQDFREIYTEVASQGSTLKKIEREVSIAETDYLENLRGYNEALQREHEQAASSDLRLVDAPVLPNKPEKSKRLLYIAAALLAGGAFPLALAVALELLSGALLSFAEAERRSGLAVVGGLARWSLARRLLFGRYAGVLRATSADLLWQGLRGRGAFDPETVGPYIVAVASLRPGAGKTHLVRLFAERLAARGLAVLAVGTRAGEYADGAFEVAAYDPLAPHLPGTQPWVRAGVSERAWRSYAVVLWELPAVATGRLPVETARVADDVLLVHPPAEGWQAAHETGRALLTQASGREPLLLLNGLPADVLLHEWGAGWDALRRWSQGGAIGGGAAVAKTAHTTTVPAAQATGHAAVAGTVLAQAHPPETHEPVAARTTAAARPEVLAKASPAKAIAPVPETRTASTVPTAARTGRTASGCPAAAQTEAPRGRVLAKASPLDSLDSTRAISPDTPAPEHAQTSSAHGSGARATMPPPTDRRAAIARSLAPEPTTPAPFDRSNSCALTPVSTGADWEEALGTPPAQASTDAAGDWEQALARR